MDSSAFMSWGRRGVGRWITVWLMLGPDFHSAALWAEDVEKSYGDGTRALRGLSLRVPAGLAPQDVRLDRFLSVRDVLVPNSRRAR